MEEDLLPPSQQSRVLRVVLGSRLARMGGAGRNRRRDFGGPIRRVPGQSPSPAWPIHLAKQDGCHAPVDTTDMPVPPSATAPAARIPLYTRLLGRCAFWSWSGSECDQLAVMRLRGSESR